jgi:hypothetical protein
MRTYTFIVAGTRAEFEDYIRAKYHDGLARSLGDYIHVDGVHVFRGHQEVHGFFIGTYEKRADIGQIREMIRVINYRTAPSVTSNGIPLPHTNQAPVNNSVNNHL